jgi:hypothetical protein
MCKVEKLLQGEAFGEAKPGHYVAVAMTAAGTA